jgi:hypothetical protein
MRPRGTSSHHQRGRDGRAGGSGGAQLNGPGGTLAGDVFTFVVCLVVVTGSIVAIGRLAPNDTHQSATKERATQRAPRARNERAPRPARAPRRPAAAGEEDTGPGRRMRSGLELAVLVAVLGTMLAGLLGVGLLLLNVLLRHAAGST